MSARSHNEEIDGSMNINVGANLSRDRSYQLCERRGSCNGAHGGGTVSDSVGAAMTETVAVRKPNRLEQQSRRALDGTNL